MARNIIPIIITFNEIDNIERTLNALKWAKKVIVVDSFSDDGTVEYCQSQTNVQLVQREFDGFANQCNYALDLVDADSWVLSLDADYVLTEELQKELSDLSAKEQTPECPNGYTASFLYAIDGNVLNGSLYPPRKVLYQRKHAVYEQDGHAHRVKVEGKVAPLNGKIIHDDRKPYKRWLASQYGYANKEKQKLQSMPFSALSTIDKVRRIPGLAPLMVVPYLLFAKGLMFSGKPGMVYLKQRVQAEWILQKALFLKSD